MDTNEPCKFDSDDISYFSRNIMEARQVYIHAMESLRFAFHAFGYDNCIKELRFMEHLHATQDTRVAVDAPTETLGSTGGIEHVQQSQPISQPIIQPNIQHTVETINKETIPSEFASLPQKNIVIDAPIKYSRALPHDDIRCVSILSGGERCSFKRASGNTLCSRHIK